MTNQSDTEDTTTVQTDRIVLSDDPPRWVTRDGDIIRIHRKGSDIDLTMSDADTLLTALEFLTDFHPRETRDTAPPLSSFEMNTRTAQAEPDNHSGTCPECQTALVDEMGGLACPDCGYRE